MKRFAQIKYGTLKNTDSIPIRLVANQTKMCQGETVCARN